MASLMTSLRSTEAEKQVLYLGDISDPFPCWTKDWNMKIKTIKKKEYYKTGDKNEKKVASHFADWLISV